jgi:hypothetical protein
MTHWITTEEASQISGYHLVHLRWRNHSGDKRPGVVGSLDQPHAGAARSDRRGIVWLKLIQCTYSGLGRLKY